jgi:hypothetical protein
LAEYSNFHPNQELRFWLRSYERRMTMFPKGLIAGLSMLILAAAVIMVDENSCRAQSQNVPNLSGTWELIEYGGTTKGQLGSKFPQMTIEISQTASEVRITQRRIRRGVEDVQEFTYYPDGRGETNMGRVELWARNVPRFESVTQWQKDKLLSSYKEQLRLLTGSSTKDGDYSSRDSLDRRKDEWRLASNGKTLALTSSTVQMNSSSITGRQPAAGGSLDDKGQIAPMAEFNKQKLVFRKTS